MGKDLLLSGIPDGTHEGLRRQPSAMAGARKIVANNLRALREVRGVAQEELAARAGIDRTYISDLENEKYAISIDKLENLAQALGVSTWQMLHPSTADDVRKRI